MTVNRSLVFPRAVEQVRSWVKRRGERAAQCFVLLYSLMLPLIQAQAQLPATYKLVYEQTFTNSRSVDQFLFTQPSKWVTAPGKSDLALEFTGKSDYEPPFRSPHTIGIIRNLYVGSFILEADLLQTGKEYGHRDMCVIFGLQDSSHFYYSHIASKMDDNAHQIMIVNSAPREKISSFTTEGIDWGQEQWHRVRIERDISTGSIRVFFDDLLIQEATDKRFAEGYIGFGSFDDSGKVDNIKIWSPEVKRKPAKIFSAREKK